jgi:hypothetical protein
VGVEVTQDTGEVDTIDAPLQPDEEELVKILGEDEDLVHDESSPPAADSEFFTAPLLDDNDNEMGRR